MKNLTFLFIFTFFCNVVSAQQKHSVEFQGITIEMPENIKGFQWANLPKSAQLANGYVGWIQFYEIPQQNVQDRFKNRNFDLLEYIGNKTYLFYTTGSNGVQFLRNNGVRSIIPVQGNTKLSENLRNGNIEPYAIQGDKLLVTLEHNTLVSTNFVISDLAEKQISVAQQYKATNIIDLIIPNNCLDALAELPYVKWVELIVAPSVPDDTRGRNLHRASGLDTQTSAGRNYTGDGIGVMVRDDGIVGPHIDFQGRIDNSNATGTGQTHGDGVGGIMAGAGNLNPSIRGMAAGSDVFVVNYQPNFLDTATTTLINDGSVQITNSSYSNGCNAGYTTITRTVDTQTHDITSLLHVFSAGNSNNNECGYGAGNQWGNITGGHKQGKNVITTANVFFDGTLVNSSSRGPAHDGRIKPDITANGQNQLSTSENNGYLTFGGTSGAAPGIAGVSAQLYEVYGDANGGTFPPSGLVKATLLNTANDYGNVGPDYKFGWGIVNGLRAAKLLEDNRYLTSSISQGTTNTHSISVPSGTTQVRFMVYWTDEPATSGATTALVNDLDLVVTAPSSTPYEPWILDPTPNPINLDAPATNGPDHLNNVEQVLINNPAAGTYNLDVSGFSVPMGPQEYFVVYEMIEEELTLTYPNGGEKFVPGTVETIHWDAINTTDSFTIEYSIDNGGSWTPTTTVPNTTTNIDWTVPSQITGDALIRITSGSFQDVSDVKFSIATQPTGLQYTIVCPQSANFSWNAVANAELYDVYLLGAETMEVAGTTSNTFISVPIVNGEEPLWAAIVAKNATQGWESRRTIAINNTGFLNCSLSDDIGIEILNTPSDFELECSGGSEVTISVRLQSFGSQPQSNFTYSYQLDDGAIIQETYTGTLASGQNVTIDFGTPLTFLANGNYTLNTAVNLAGDENPFNDTDTLDFFMTLEPTALDFEETFETNGFPPSGWTLNNPDNSTTWQQRDNVVGSDGTTTTTAFMDGANYSASGQLDTFTLEYIDLQGATGTSLSFDLAKAQWSTAYNDRLEVEISIDCGATFTNIYSKDGLTLATVPYINAAWTPSSSSDWRTENLSLAAYEGQIVQIRFINVNDYSNNTFIDNIKVDGIVINQEPTRVSLAGGELLIEDIVDKDDTLTITYGGGIYTITDTNGGFINTMVPGSMGDGTATVTIPEAGVTSILVNTIGGDDLLTVDYSGGNFAVPIAYNGGTHTNVPGDLMMLSGGPTFTGVTHTFVNANDGSVAVAGNGLLTYTGLEPIVDNLSATDRVFNFTGGAETITLDNGGTLVNQIDSTLGESVDFNNPSGSLTINTEVGVGTGADILNIEGLDANFDADLTVNSGNDDNVNFLLNPTAIASGDIAVTTGILNISQDIATTGNINLTSERNTTINNNATLSITDGAITMLAGTTPVVGDVYKGILLENGNLSATSGAITLTGTGSNDGVSSRTQGVFVTGASLLETTTGEITITGTGASSGLDRMSGIRINDNAANAAILRSVDGTITLNGTGGNGTSDFNVGVVIDGLNPIQLTGNGSLDVTGQGGAGAQANYGIGIQTATVSVADGTITLNGTSGNGSSNFQAGVSIGFDASLQISGPGAMNITGSGGNGVDAGYGVYVFNNASLSVSSGAINLIGTAANGTGNFNSGVNISTGATIEATGNGAITITGTGAAGVQNNRGVLLGETSITTAGGGTSITGQGGTGDLGVTGIIIFDSTTIADTADGAIVLNGTAGVGIQQNSGVLSLGTIQSFDGPISITGVGNGTANNNQGVALRDTALIENLGEGSILIDGQAGNGNDLFNIGVLSSGTVRSIDGGITIIGQGNGTNNENHGINIFENGLVESTGDGAISFTGTGANGFRENIGILLDGVAPRVLSYNGAVTFNGVGGNATDNFNSGVALEEGATIASSGTGAITLNGTGVNGFSGNNGVVIEGTTTSVASNGGGISMTGTGGTGGGNLNVGIRVDGATILDLSSTGSISIDGTGGSSSDVSVGVFFRADASIITNGGGIAMIGQGGSGPGDFNAGIMTQETVTITDTAMGDISLNGTGGSGVNTAGGIFLYNTAVTSVDGSLSAIGMGGTGTEDYANGIYMQDSALDTGSGNITLDGTGGAGDALNSGILSFTSSFNTTDGAIQMTGEATDVTGDFNQGIGLVDNLIEATNGAISLVGTSGDAANPGIEIASTNSPITAGSTITVTTNVGVLNTPEGIPATAVFEAATTSINGTIAPGPSVAYAVTNTIGQTTITGDFDLTAGSLEVEIENLTIAGIDFDQIVVNGLVDITGATLTLVDNFAGVGTPSDVIILIDNDGVDAVTGTFTGLPEGASINFNEETWFIYYAEGDGNDVALRFRPINILVDAGGNLVFTDIVGEDDELTIIKEGTNYRISDPNKPVIAGEGAIQDGDEVVVPIASVTGDININTLNGDDSLNVDLDGGDFEDTINYNGGNQNTSPGDSMLLSSAGMYTNVTHNFINESDGFVDVTGNNTINYTGLEPILDNLNAADRVFNFTGGAETITVNAGGTLDNQIDSTLGESVDFNNPTTSLTINTEVGGGSGADTVNMEGIALGFDADLTINGGADDVVNFQTNPTAIGTGNLTATGLGIFVFQNITTSGLGAIDFTANRNIYVQPLATVSSQDGAITFIANSSGALSATQDFDAILINGEVNTSGTGSIDFTGNGGSTGATEFNIGIAVEGANAKVETTGTGAITMTGTGGSGSSNNSGVMVSFGGLIAANGSAIDITGNGGSDGFGIHNIGVRLRVNGTISNTGAGTISLNGTGADNGNSNYGVQALGGSIVSAVNGEITLNGTGGNGAHANQGLRIEGAGTKITTIDGGITLNGTGGNATGNNNEGVTIILDALIEATGSGAINITGNAVSGLNLNKGVVFFNADMSSAGGGITINGTGGGTNNNNLGISIEGGSVIEDTLDGNISLTGSGAAGVDFNIGVDITGGSFIRINDGDISIMATGGNGTGNNNLGLRNSGGSIIEATGMGSINLVGEGGNGTDYNDGVRIENSSSVTATTGGINIQGIGATGSVGEANMGVNIASNSSIIASSTNNISIEGTGGSGTQFNRGIVFSFNSITSSGGNIDIIATGGTGTGNFQVGLTAFPGTSINTNGAGTIGILGTGGVGPTTLDTGIELIGTTQITSENGAITIDGVAVDGSIGNRIEATITATGTGNVFLNGTTTSATQAAINILNDNTTITAGGNITATANIGKLNTPAEIPGHAIFEATNTIINGILAPGQSPGQLTVNGNFTMSSGDTAEIEINAITTPGTDYDQIKVTGTVDISGATLSLIDNIPGVLVEGAEIIIIANDGVDAVVGTFDGLTTTTPIPFNEQFVFVHYDGGDGNDVSLVVDSMPTAICQDYTVQVDASGNVTILPSDIDNGSFDPDGPVTLSVSPDTFDCSAAGIPQIVTLTVTDNTGNTDTCEATVTIEKRPTTLTYSGDLVEQYSDQVDLSATLVDVDGISLEGKTVSFTIGTQSITALTDINGLAEATLILTQDPNITYTVATEFIEDDCYLGSTVSVDFDITQEDAIVAYTGQTLQATPSENESEALVVLSANIQDITVTDFANDPFEGDIRKAMVMFVKRLDNGGIEDISGWLPVENLIDPNDPTTGTVSYDWMVDLQNQDSESFTVGILVGSLDDNGYYLRDDSDDYTVVTVYKPVGDFITGGGNIIPDNSAGQYASTDGLKTNFGFNVKFNAGGRRLKGHMNVIFRILEVDGVHTYQIKGNAIQSLGVDVGDPANKIAEFITKANLKDITDPNNPISLGGNLLLKADMTDKGEPGDADSIGLTLTTSNGELLYSSDWTGIETQEMVLAAGNIVVHSGFSSKGLLYTDDMALTLAGISLYPNPAKEQVTIGNSNNLELDEAAIYDQNGRLIYRIDLRGMGVTKTVSLQEMAAATYVVIIKGKDGEITKRLLKE